MKFRVALLLTAGMLLAMVVPAAAQHDHSSTPESHQHGDHMSATPAMDMDNLSTGAFYFTVTNSGDEPDRLVKIESDIAQAIEIHEVKMDGGVMTMSPQHDGVEIPANGELVLEPSGYHVMLIGINKSLLDGEEFTATLFFENAGEVEVIVPIFMSNPGENEFGDSVKVGDTIEVSNVWARQAPKLEGSSTPVATPVD